MQNANIGTLTQRTASCINKQLFKIHYARFKGKLVFGTYLYFKMFYRANLYFPDMSILLTTIIA